MLSSNFNLPVLGGIYQDTDRVCFRAIAISEHYLTKEKIIIYENLRTCEVLTAYLSMWLWPLTEEEINLGFNERFTLKKE